MREPEALRACLARPWGVLIAAVTTAGRGAAAGSEQIFDLTGGMREPVRMWHRCEAVTRSTTMAT